MAELFSEPQIKTAIQTLAHHISTQCKQPLAFIGIETKGYILANRLKLLCEEQLHTTIQVGKLDISLYHPLSTNSNFVSIGQSSISFSLKGKTIILIDEEIDTGKTITAALNALSDYDEPENIKCCCLLNKNNLTRPIAIDYIGFNSIPATTATSCLFYETDGEDAIVNLNKT